MTARRNANLLLIMIIGLYGLCGSLPPARSQVKLLAAFVPRKEEGEKTPPNPDQLGDIARIQANADSKSGIARVTFEVDEQFRVELKKPPYVYEWDTLEENDGKHTVSVTAYSTRGQTAVQRLKVVVANQLNLGVKHFVQEGMDAFASGNYLLLDKDARKAFKISRVDVDAIRLMALDAGIRGDTGRGFQLLDDQQNNVPKYEEFTKRVRGYLFLGRAASQNSVQAMLSDLEAGLKLVREQVAADAELIDKSYPESATDFATQLARGDALFTHGKYPPALTAYEQAAKIATDKGDRAAAQRGQQRQVMTLLRQGRLQEAETLAIKIAHGVEATPTSQALWAAVLFHQRRWNEARDAARAAAEAHNPVGLVVATLADLARNDRDDAYLEAREAVNLVESGETQYVAMATLSDVGQAEPARRTFRIAFLHSPLYTPILTERAYEIMAYTPADDRWIQAMNLFDLVLKAEPENPNALAGRVAVMVHLGRFTSASPVVARMIGNDPTAPDILVLKAAADARGADTSKEIHKTLEQAHEMDPINFNGGNLPLIEEFSGTMARLRRVVPLTPAFLDLANNPPKPQEAPEPAKSARANP
jgi:tetratricopeptide (TPR) repeat protein